ncbi:MAG: hypothetical protein D6806_04040 [Deltaproteobacteria bacterium]|nr:MAG: hypothetical protein D6806_04040 [Deltaproteobacteria bacterium]
MTRPEKKSDRLKSAAIVKLKYQLLTGGLDDGFREIFAGVCRDLDLDEAEVDSYLERNRHELEKLCGRD